MRKCLLYWYWTLAVAPLTMLIAMGATAAQWDWSTEAPPTAWAFPVMLAFIAAMFGLSFVTLSLSLVGFPIVTRRFAPTAMGRWPLYAALAALTVGTFVSSVLFIITFEPMGCGTAGPVPMYVRS